MSVDDVGITVADATMTRFYTTLDSQGELDLLAAPTVDTLPVAAVDEGVLWVSLPAMGFVTIEIIKVLGDVTADGRIDVDDLLAVIAGEGLF